MGSWACRVLLNALTGLHLAQMSTALLKVLPRALVWVSVVDVQLGTGTYSGTGASTLVP